MPKTSPSLLSLIGDTPLVEIKNIDTGLCKLFVKMESHNPGGSIKDRTASYIIDQAEKDGLLKPGGTIIEATAGNTGIGLALVGILKGYRVVLVIPDKMSLEKVAHLKALGAEVIFTRSDVGKDHPEYYHNMAEDLIKKIPGSFYADQFNNPANILAHEETTGPEIWDQTDGKIDGFVCSSGTGGTISGTSSYLKEKTISVSDQEAFEAIHILLKKEGILAGSSAGTLFAGAIKWCKNQKEPKRVVTLICDTGNKYLSKAFNEKWLIHNDLIIKDPKGDLQDVIAFRADKNQIIYVNPDDTLATAFNRMNNSDISQLPVLKEEKLIGMITETDILNHCRNQKGFEKSVSECMQKNYKSLEINSSLDDLIELLKENNIAIILNKEKFVGIITKIDLLAYLKRN